MATVAPNLKFDASSADNFANWVNAIHSAIVTTAGWTQTTDTGQAITQAGGLTVSITNIVRTTTVCTLTYASQGSYPFITGQTILVATSGTFSPTASGTFVITGVPSSTTLTYTTASGTIVSVADTGTIKLFAAAGGFVNRIYHATDSLQATGPIFLKIRFGRSGSGNVPIIGFQLGQGSDGSGNLTGATSVETVSVATSTASGSTSYTCHLAGGTSWLSMELWSAGIASLTVGYAFAVERSRDNTGAETDSYFSYLVATDSSTVDMRTIFKAGTISGAEVGLPISFPTNAAFNNGIWTYQWSPIIGKQGNPHIGAIAPAALVNGGSSVTISFYGVNHTLLVVSGAATSIVPFQYLAKGSQNAAWLMRYE